jgi:hypothetical protein
VNLLEKTLSSQIPDGEADILIFNDLKYQ